MADLLQAGVVQQLEVALLGSLAAQVVDLLSGRLAQTNSSTSATPAQPHLRIYTSTLPAPPPSSVLVMRVPTTSQIPVVVPTMESSSGVKESAPAKAKVSKIPDDFQCWCITPTVVCLLSSVGTSLSSSSAAVFPFAVGPELAIPVEAYPE